MFDWNVFVRGRLVGTVSAESEQAARQAAYSDFDIDDEALITAYLVIA